MAKEAARKNNEDPQRAIRPMSSNCEDAGSITLRLEMPGVDKKDVDLQLENNELVISGIRKRPQEALRYVLRERHGGDYQQVYTVDDTIDSEGINAKMENGVLTVTLPLRESLKPRRIEITSG
mgnify:CR=1 FL=1